MCYEVQGIRSGVFFNGCVSYCSNVQCKFLDILSTKDTEEFSKIIK